MELHPVGVPAAGVDVVGQKLPELVAAALVERAVGQLADQISQDGIGCGNPRSSASLRSMQPIRAIRSRRSTIFTAATVFRSLSAMAAIDVLASSVDFYHQKQGDRFKVVYEQHIVEGEPVGTGKIIAAMYEREGKELKTVKSNV